MASSQFFRLPPWLARVMCDIVTVLIERERDRAVFVKKSI